MTINEQMLAALSLYGTPVLAAIVFFTSFGIPLPSSLALLLAGSLIQQGDMNVVLVVISGTAAAILGDILAYWAGRWGGPRFRGWLSRRIVGEKKLLSVEDTAQRWGGAGIFLSRWLITPLGPWLNYISGIAQFPFGKFFVWDFAGQMTWVIIYLIAGGLFSTSVQTISDFFGSLAWAMIGLVAILVFASLLVRSFRNNRQNH